MALEHGVTLYIRPRSDPTIRLAATNPVFEPRTFEAGPDIRPFPDGDWGNYVKAAVQELVRDDVNAVGFDALVHSTLPIAAGLSSSSALVVASALAFLHANGRDVAPLDLAARMADAERFVGTRGGGMDQAICLCGREGAACRIDFEPLGLEPVPVPAGWVFIVADSGIRAEKSGAARDVYNARTRELANARAAMTGPLGLAPDASWRQLLTVERDDVVLSVAGSVLDARGFRRFRHVLTEAGRVRQAESAMRSRSLEAFGEVLDASHESLARDYEVSIDALDGLVAVARGAGAAGARLTGAGFGGCIVALCREAVVAEVERELFETWYAPRGLEAVADTGLFIARPGPGARLTAL
jgi:galactokinase